MPRAGDKLAGLAVHIASRVALDEVLVSGWVRDLLAGSAMTFEDRGGVA